MAKKKTPPAVLPTVTMQAEGQAILGMLQGATGVKLIG